MTTMNTTPSNLIYILKYAFKHFNNTNNKHYHVINVQVLKHIKDFKIPTPWTQPKQLSHRHQEVQTTNKRLTFEA